ncbi:efflux RND transporter periplasmic adaptor subunit [Zunongwangia endophytica]|uniref:Efflux RND transporter periplasmic adaptor subunit n=1 Tax=Zunongwangia endophytica TaxID=1808945 RepID=A0ABV8H9E1_9FLAO|nr:efflux RND transporter periplasmic adaptor subunit [Zunongwangia endophytica]MDN3593685.1 efflux RND transporter periplasmic adaptor subunit [Zunongwangia endophytica]
MRNIRLTLLSLSILIAISCGEEKKTKSIEPISVKTMTIGKNQELQNTQNIGFTGKIIANKKINLSFQIGGTIEYLKVDMGDFVKKGELLAEVDATAYREQYQAKKAQAELAKENYERINEVYLKGSIAEIKMIEARSKYQQAKAAANAVYQNVKHSKLYAPTSGYIGAKIMESGDLASPGRPVYQLLDIEKVKAVIPIPDGEVNQLKTGDSAKVEIDALDNKLVEGEITEISIQSNQQNPVYIAQITIPNPDKNIKPGMSCAAFIDFKENQSNSTSQIVLPVQVVSVTEINEYFVYVAEDGKAKRKVVTLGKLYKNGIAITKGLKKSDQVITSGYHKLTDNTPIKLSK